MKIRITVGNVSLEAELNDSPMAKKITSILPFERGFQTWSTDVLPRDIELIRHMQHKL